MSSFSLCSPSAFSLSLDSRFTWASSLKNASATSQTNWPASTICKRIRPNSTGKSNLDNLSTCPLVQNGLKHLCSSILSNFRAWAAFNQNKSNWHWIEHRLDPVLCGNSSGAGECPVNYTCYQVRLNVIHLQSPHQCPVHEMTWIYQENFATLYKQKIYSCPCPPTGCFTNNHGFLFKQIFWNAL